MISAPGLSAASKNGRHRAQQPALFDLQFRFSDARGMEEAFSGRPDANIYSRYSNLHTDELIGKVCDMEGAEDGFASASGRAIIGSALASIREND